MYQYTLSQLRSVLAPWVEGGLCPDDDGGPNGANRVTMGINEACERLSKKSGWPGLLRCVRMCVHNGCVTMPRDIRKVLKARMEGQYAHVFDKWYEFLEAGPGMLEDDTSSYIDLIDRDRVVTQYDILEPRKVMVMSDRAEVMGARILIRGYDETNREVMSETSDGMIMGEYVDIERDVAHYTYNTFSAISHVIKPTTNGYVYLSAVEFGTDADTGRDTITRDHLSYYHPDETVPNYRRYGFKTLAYQEASDYDYRLNALVKLRFVPMSHDEDVCIIDNMPAIKTMLQAIRYYNNGDIEKGNGYEMKAEQLLLEDVDDYETIEATPDLQVDELREPIESV